MKKFVVIITILSLLFSLSACSSKDLESGAKEPLEALTIGILPDVDSIPLVIAMEKGFFEEEGLTVNIEQFKSPVDRDTALQSGTLDGAVSDVLAEAFAKDKGFDLVITSMTNGSYKLLVSKNSNISSLEDLKGKDIAMSRNTIIEYTTDMMIAEGGLSPEDINKVAIPNMPVRLEMLQNGSLAAATLPDPLATTAIQNGANLLNSSDNLGVNPGVLLFKSEAIETKSESIKAMYKAYNKAIDYLKNEDIDSYIDILIEKGGFPESVKGNIILPEYTNAKLPTEKDVKDVINWLLEKELIKTSLTFDEIVNADLIN